MIISIYQIIQYEGIIAVIDTVLQHLLEDTFYDTVHNFVNFHESYRASNCKHLQNFFQIFSPSVDRRHFTCVSLGMEIIARISEILPDVAEHFYLVSCEEAVENCNGYVEACEDNTIERAGFGLEKEHSLVAMSVIIANRKGIALLDPGYHVARAVTVMQDKGYPHTGWFLKSDEKTIKREYCYTFNEKSASYVEWHEKVTRNSIMKAEVSLIFTDRAYLTAVDVTIKRNLVYNFRSLLSRNAKGHVCAGFYFPVGQNNDTFVTLFYDGADSDEKKVKHKLSIFNESSAIPLSLKKTVAQVANQLRMHQDELLLLLKKCSDALADKQFIKEVLVINNEIGEMSLNN